MTKSITLPYSGTVIKMNCFAIRLNYGLHTQCVNKKYKNIEYCKVCKLNIEKTENNYPTFGDIRDRLKVGIMDYVDPRGKKTMPYNKLLKRLKVTKEEVENEAIKYGVVIDEQHWGKASIVENRGRPKKEYIVIDENDLIMKEELNCVLFEFDNRKFIRTQNDLLFDIDTESYVGEFNICTNMINYSK
jgi:hypothetical protein